MPQIPYRRPYLYPAQQSALFNDARWKVIEASTKSGKTHGALVWITEQAALDPRPRGHNYWWVAPIHPQAKMAYTRLTGALPPALFRENKTELTVTLANGAVIWFKGSDNPDSLFGEDVYGAVVDEASRVKEASWTAVRSTLTATQGSGVLIGNVKGKKNWFYRWARAAESGEPGRSYAKLTAYDAVSAGLFPEDEIEDARRSLPEPAFKELYLAEPADSGARPFSDEDLEACTQPLRSDSAARVWGWDLARKRDWTVGVALDSERQSVRFERFQLPWAAQVKTIKHRTGITAALVDQTGVGDAIVDRLQEGTGNFEGFIFTPKSRQALLEGLAHRVSERSVSMNELTASELSEFEYQYSATGVRYAVPDGMHDDCAMALALANRHLDHGSHVTRFEWL